MLKVLNVAEKNDAAKSIAKFISKGNSRMRDGFSKFNKIYECEAQVFNQRSFMVMTSVSGHLLSLDFKAEYKAWNSCSPLELFDAPVEKSAKNFMEIKRTLEREARQCTKLVIWTDCDREGENIGFEIIQVCKAVKPGLDVYRATFSEITSQSIHRALNGLTRPNPLINDAVDARIELDLRIGAAFTRFQTLRIKKTFPEISADRIVSYGSCQFPTLGFVVERFKQNQDFVPEPFWKIIVRHKRDDKEIEFTWERGRLFDYPICNALYSIVIENPTANVVDVKTKPKSKWRPAALDTIELEKIASRKLKINAKETMKIAESLYTKGYISYPRTETNQFPKDFHLAQLVELHVNDQNWGDFAGQILQNGVNPRNGNKSDQAHPPIHPIKYSNDLTGKEQTVYEFIVRHFLACCSQDAKGMETTITLEVSQEKFSAAGLMIIERNYLEVYPYEKWSDKEIPVYHQGESFMPSSIELKEGNTAPPPLLTESDLIALMEKHGIGTDATHAEHIETIKERNYANVRHDGRFVPCDLGLGLVEGYDLMGYAMSKPNLRASLEEDLKRIQEGRKTKEEVLREQVNAYKSVFEDAFNNVRKLDEALSKYFGAPTDVVDDTDSYEQLMPIFECSCKSQMVLRTKKDGKGFYIGCRSYPECKRAVWFPSAVLDVAVTNELCDKCAPNRVKKLKFKFERGSIVPTIPLDYVTCILCDEELRQSIQIKDPRQTQTVQGGNENGYRGASTSNQSNNNYSSYNSNSANVQPVRRPDPLPRNPIPNRAPAAPANTSLNNSGNDDSNPIVCYCSNPAPLLTVRKEGPNQGRQFYACTSKACQFFMWADATDNSNATDANSSFGNSNSYSRPPTRPPPGKSNRGGGGGGGGGGGDSSGVQCQCGTTPSLLTVVKAGPNQGRKFYKCSACNFFEWEDSPGGDGGNNGGGGGGYGGGSGGYGGGGSGGGGNSSTFSVSNFAKKKPNNNFGGGGASFKSKDSTPKKRKCGVCGQEGHNKKNCPNLN